MILFGTTQHGEDVHAITLSAHGLTVQILTLGAILHSVKMDGVAHSLTVNPQALSDYEGVYSFHGAVVGPVANRIGHARAAINGQVCQFDPSDAGPFSLHGGQAGVHTKVWSIDEISDNSLTLSHSMPNGEGGYPGNRRAVAQFEILSGPTLRLTLSTSTDAPSIANLTNHSYWNLDGSGHMRSHTLRVAADHFIPLTPDQLPTGEIAAVTGTPFDTRNPVPVVAGTPPLDTTFCVADTRRALTEVLWLTGASGLTLTVATTETGVHLYDGRPAYDSLAIEAQGWPDAPNHADFPSIDITPDAPSVQVTQWRFSR